MSETQYIVYEPFFKLWIAFYSEFDGNAYGATSRAIRGDHSLSDFVKRERLARLLSGLRHTVRWDLPPMIELPTDLAWAEK